MERTPAAVPPQARIRDRAGRALRERGNWVQLGKFLVVGASGYIVNLVVYSVLVQGSGFHLHYLAAATVSFLFAVTNNYLWNRLWTFRGQRGNVAYQGMRFFVVAVVSLGANLLVLQILIGLGTPKVRAQAIAIVLATPLNFLGNKLWSFKRR